MNSEERSNDGVALWSCPECAFTFDAAHTDTDGGGYSCPLCAEIDLESRLAAALARIAAVEACDCDASRDGIPHHQGYCRSLPTEERHTRWLTQVANMSKIIGERCDALDRLTAVEAWAMKNEIAAPPLDWAGLGAILHPAASPTPTGPEPAKCEHKRTEAHQMLDEFCEWTADCPGPATPEPTEETP